MEFTKSHFSSLQAWNTVHVILPNEDDVKLRSLVGVLSLQKKVWSGCNITIVGVVNVGLLFGHLLIVS